MSQPPVTNETCKQVSSLLFPPSQGSGLTVEIVDIVFSGANQQISW